MRMFYCVSKYLTVHSMFLSRERPDFHQARGPVYRQRVLCPLAAEISSGHADQALRQLPVRRTASSATPGWGTREPLRASTLATSASTSQRPTDTPSCCTRWCTPWGSSTSTSDPTETAMSKLTQVLKAK